ncbi:MAG: winged helix DNA-binding domain-containing protein [Actinobacteria bacterium]|nr:winged helix DNA-binding domain-containing protein [Actinomycetota bacterium]
MITEVGRKQVLAYRAAAQGLDRSARTASRLGVFDLGFQDTPAGSAAIGLAARLREARSNDALIADESLALAWTFRGAPHLHRRADLPELAPALWPLGEDDAYARLAAFGSDMKKAGRSALEAQSEAAKAMRAVVAKPMTKGDVSGAVTKRAPDYVSLWCRSCNCTHIHEQLFRLSALPAGLALTTNRSPVMLSPIDGRPRIPRKAAGTESLVRAYLTFLGPATESEVASFLGTNRPLVGPVWPDDLSEVSIDGKRAWLPRTNLSALKKAKPGHMVRLLPPYDPYLQARDRGLLLEDKAQQKSLWRGVLGAPGALFVDGEITGVWRAKMAGKKRLVVTVDAFGSPTRRAKTAVEKEAEVVAAARGASDVEVRFGS